MSENPTTAQAEAAPAEAGVLAADGDAATASAPAAAPLPGSEAVARAAESRAAQAPVAPPVQAPADPAAAARAAASTAPATPAPTAAPASDAAPTLPVVNVGAPSAAAATAPAAVTGPAGGASGPTTAQLGQQLSGPLGRLREAAPGEHVMTLRVNPETFGPVRVVAHIGAEGVRIELLGATDAARDALRQSLTDLRRDLAATGLKADLQLSAQSGDGGREREGAGALADSFGSGSDRSDRSDRSGRTAGTGRTATGASPPTADAAPTNQPDTRPDGRLDLIA